MHSTFLRASKKSDNRSALILSPRLIAIVVSVEQLSTKCVFIQEQKVNILGSFNHFLEWNRNLIDPERWPLPLLLRNYRLFFVNCCPSLTPWGVVLRRVPRGVNRLKQWRMKSNIFPFVPVRLAFWDEKCFFFIGEVWNWVTQSSRSSWEQKHLWAWNVEGSHGRTSLELFMVGAIEEFLDGDSRKDRWDLKRV